MRKRESEYIFLQQMSSLLKLAPATQIDKEVILQKRKRGPEVAAKVWFAF